MNPVWPAYSQREAPVRYRDPDFEYKCPTCLVWLPISRDFWLTTHGMRRCKACWNEYAKLKQRGYDADPAVRNVHRFKGRIRYSLNKERLNAANRKWKAENKEHVREYNRLYRLRAKGFVDAAQESMAQPVGMDTQQ